MRFDGRRDRVLQLLAVAAVNLLTGLDGDPEVGATPLALHLHHLGVIGRSA